VATSEFDWPEVMPNEPRPAKGHDLVDRFLGVGPTGLTRTFTVNSELNDGRLLRSRRGEMTRLASAPDARRRRWFTLDSGAEM
jgi:hypothetical protein